MTTEPGRTPSDAVAPSPAGSGPVSPEDAAFIQAWDARMRLPIVLAALLPLVVSPDATTPLAIVVGVVSWLVFVADFVVHARHLDHYLRTGLGRFDLAIVILTSPWYLLPSAQGGAFIVVLRLARLVRLVIAARGARRLFERLGRVALVALLIVVVAAAVAYYAEHATNPGFETFGDAMWWGYVTLTTVGYGDIVPKTFTGRLAGVVIMTSGIALLGVLAGALASFFRLTPGEAAQPLDEAPDEQRHDVAPEAGPVDGPSGGVGGSPAAGDDPLASLTRQVADLRDEIRQLTEHVRELQPPGDTPR